MKVRTVPGQGGRDGRAGNGMREVREESPARVGDGREGGGRGGGGGDADAQGYLRGTTCNVDSLPPVLNITKLGLKGFHDAVHMVTETSLIRYLTASTTYLPSYLPT